MALTILVAAAWLLGCGADSSPQGQSRAPDVVLVTVDALRADVLSLSGWPDATSPELDAMAADSVVFDLAVTSFPGTPPAMTSLMTGLFPWVGAPTAPTKRTDHGFSDFHPAPGRFGVPAELDTLAEILARNGYGAIGFNTNPYLNSPSGFHQGFTEYVEFEPDPEPTSEIEYHALVGKYAPASFVVETILDRLEEPLPRPFFLWLHLMDPHSPYLPPPQLARAFPRTFSDRTDLEINEAVYHEIYRQWGATEAADTYPSYKDLGLTRATLREHLLGLYEAEVRYADYELGRLFRRLQELGRWQTSVVIVTADHGEELLDHGLVSHHTLNGLKDELIRIPLIVKLPESEAAGTRVDELVRMVDITPTVLDVVGLGELASGMDGKSLRPYLEGAGDEPRVAPIVTVGYGMIRTARWKYLHDWNDTTGARGRLFDLAADPTEERDVAAARPVVADELRARLDRVIDHLRARSDGVATQSVSSVDELRLDASTREQLEGLGYLTGDN